MVCGAKPVGHKKFCRHCGVAVNPEQVVCVQCGAGLPGNLGANATAAANTTMANLKSAFQSTENFTSPVIEKIKNLPKQTITAAVITIVAVSLCLLIVHGIASSREQAEIKRYLEYHGVNAEFVSGRNANELFRTAVDQWNVPVIKFLVSKGADVNYHPPTRYSPLQAAVRSGDIERARILISLGADVNKGFPLNLAVLERDVAMVRFLVSKGADVNANAGTLMGVPQTPLNMAQRFSRTRPEDNSEAKQKTLEADSKAIIRILERAGAK